MFVSFLYIYNMLLNTPNRPWSIDLDSMSALTLADLAPASLGTNFAGGGYAGSRKNLRNFIFRLSGLRLLSGTLSLSKGRCLLRISLTLSSPTCSGISFPCVILDRQGGDPYIYKTTPKTL